MPERVLNKIFDTVERTIQNLQERENLSGDDAALKKLRTNVARRIAETGITERGDPSNADTPASHRKLPKDR